jgi:hypothetical protein
MPPEETRMTREMRMTKEMRMTRQAMKVSAILFVLFSILTGSGIARADAFDNCAQVYNYSQQLCYSMYPVPPDTDIPRLNQCLDQVWFNYDNCYGLACIAIGGYRNANGTCVLCQDECDPQYCSQCATVGCGSCCADASACEAMWPDLFRDCHYCQY